MFIASEKNNRLLGTSVYNNNISPSSLFVVIQIPVSQLGSF